MFGNARLFRKDRAKLVETEERNYLAAAFSALIMILVVKHFWPEVIPFGTTELWKVKQGGVVDWLRVGIPVFAWGVGITFIARVFSFNSRRENGSAEKLFAVGTLFSLWAGVMEEICFRWLIFMNAIIGVKVGNYLFFGWLGFGIGEWFQLHVAGPISDWFTWGYLADYLRNPEMWAVGAAILSANAFFRDGHRYLGWFGVMNAWFAGMFLFWVMFHYGLPAAIVIHFTYDFLLDIVVYLDRVVERRFGWNNGH